MKNQSYFNFKANTKITVPKTPVFSNSFLLSPFSFFTFSNSFLLLANVALAKVAHSSLLSTFSFFALTISFLLSPSSTFSQAPDIEWQNTIGGDDYEYLYAVEQTTDGGYILGGESRSELNGDKTEVNVGSSSSCDYWVVKISSTGSIEWQNTIGGNSNDHLYSIKQTSDGGYILGGSSTSGINGDKTEVNLGGIFYGDYWVIKLNSAGIIEWQNTIGGPDDDILMCVKQTSDGGYILAGYSRSGIGGDKSEISLGGYDYWIVKISNLGIVEWQNTYGGSEEERLYDLDLTNDGGYILGGYSYSPISGDKTQENIGTIASSDYWIIKIDVSGNILWQKTIGGSSNDKLKSLIVTSDGGYIAAGNSTSGISGNKSELNFGGFGDYWIVKLSDLGIIEWENTIGGNNTEECGEIRQTIDGGYIIAGSSESSISVDKTEDNFGPVNHADDYWIVKIDPSGIVEWDNTIGGNKSDYLHAIAETEDGGFILAGNSESYASGDKTENTVGGGLEITDYWVVKIEGNCLVAPEICNSLDDNCNGLIDDGITETISISAGGSTTFCQGGNVILSAAYSGTSIQWKKNGINIPGATSSAYIVNVKGTYTCATTSPCGAALSSPIIVNILKNPTASISAGGATTFCAGGSVTLTEAPVAGSTYQWYKGAIAIPGATSTNYIATIAGIYRCRVTKTVTGCFKNSNTISVSVPCKESMETLNSEINIYPNPAADKITINIDIKFILGSITITDISGKKIIQQELKSGISEFEISSLTSGLYFINFNIDGITSTQKFIKQ